MQVDSKLIDARNWGEEKDLLTQKVKESDLIGIDLETWDEPHQGIDEFRGNNKTKVFDINRTYIAGFSIYCEDDEVAYYLNLNHADAENRLPWHEARQILDAKRDDAYWIAHNAPFEITMLWKSLDHWIGNDNIICTLQMAVSAYGPDEYDVAKFDNHCPGGIKNVFVDAAKLFQNYDPRQGLTEDQEELIGKVCAKQSSAKHSYNGFVNDIAYGYGLKKAVKSFFGIDMRTFNETVGPGRTMKDLTGEECCAYGADDSFYAVALFYALYKFMKQTNTDAITAFFEQENPMVPVYAKLWGTGMRVSEEGIKKGRDAERAECARILRELKPLVYSFLPFDNQLNTELLDFEKWYEKNAEKYRNRIQEWATKPNVESDFQQVMQVDGAVAKPWAEENEYPYKLTGPNFTFYMIMRTLLYDLLREHPMKEYGKIQSDGGNRGRLLDRIGKRLEEEESDVDRRKKQIIEMINQLAGVEQRMKLYLTPYSKLVDPGTNRLYPHVTSMLASRRMASENPNAMQLAKQGQSTYVRGFFKADYDDHVLVSIDWSQIELVLIGELSGDPEFYEAYGTLPYNDLHKKAAADILSAVGGVDISPEQFASLKTMGDDVKSPFGFPLVDGNGTELSPKQAYKYNRGTAGGKGANFGYWYSGSLSSVALARGVGVDLMWKMTDAYRERFSVAEEWRLRTIREGQAQGWVKLPDGHRRVRYEATTDWWHKMKNHFSFRGDGVARFGQEVAKRIARRAGNQLVNSMIQGSCSTLAKRSILGVEEEIDRQKFDAVFKMPVHDELLWSVHKDQVIPFIHMAKSVMKNHPDIISSLKMDATAAVGRTFEPFDHKHAPLGQVELEEAPKIPDVVPDEKVDGALSDKETQNLIDWMFQ